MITFRPYQFEAVNAAFNYYNSGGCEHGVIALPTGTGKSLIAAAIICQLIHDKPSARVVCATHVKELVRQDYDALNLLWPNAPSGICSAGLKRYDTFLPVIFGGIGTMSSRVDTIGFRDLLIVDEAHLISGKNDSEYGAFIDALRTINPYLIVIGLSATPYRMGNGLLTDGPLFSKMLFDLTGIKEFNELIRQGYLCRVDPKRTKTELDVSNVGIINGDFAQGELQHAVDKESVTYAAVKEIVEWGQTRNSWMVFAAGVDHAIHVSEMLRSFGVPAAAVHSKLCDKDRDAAINAFKSGEIRCVVNNNVLTTGFDHPALDMIGMLRPTMSTPLWVQMLGRGTRPYPGKTETLVLDFAGNTRRLGPINDPVIPKKRSGKGGLAPVRICEMCGSYCHARATECESCGHVFPQTVNIAATADSAELIRSDLPEVLNLPVHSVNYNRYEKNGRAMLRCDYFSGLMRYQKYVTLEHGGFAAKKARDWWRKATGDHDNVPATTDEALQRLALLQQPKTIDVWVNKTPPEIVGVNY
jgi:DNA repair protein RadD